LKSLRPHWCLVEPRRSTVGSALSSRSSRPDGHGKHGLRAGHSWGSGCRYHRGAHMPGAALRSYGHYCPFAP
jgi:hypothetical protein